jgi:hypothetical protein
MDINISADFLVIGKRDSEISDAKELIGSHLALINTI